MCIWTEKKHNATLSPRLNWKLQRINNVRLFGLCICLFFFFSCSFFFIDCSTYVARGLFLLQNNYNISGFFGALLKAKKNVWVQFEIEMENNLCVSWNFYVFMNWILCEYMWPGILFDRVLFTRNWISRPNILFYRRFK